MYKLLNDICVIEASAFVAAPLCSMVLAQLGAKVIRVDQIGGGPDYLRWPLAPGGGSLYWDGLNKGKKSVALDLKHPEGREILTRLITREHPGSGLFVTNFPENGFLSHSELKKKKKDLISLRIMGNPDGTSAVDYTINVATGLPLITGDPEVSTPVNHVLPAWDVITGLYGALSLLATERRRRSDGLGAEIKISLADVAFASMGNLGFLGEVATSQTNRPRYGNVLFGAFGRDFVTLDNKRVMIVAITSKQWRALVKTFNCSDEIIELEKQTQEDFLSDAGARFRHHEALVGIFEPRIAKLPFQSLQKLLNENEVCWGPYQTLLETLNNDERVSEQNPIFSMETHASTGTYLTPAYPASISGSTPQQAAKASRLGADTEEVLSDILNLSTTEIQHLIDNNIAFTSAS